MPVSFRPATEHRQINDFIRRIELQALRLRYPMEAASNNRKKNDGDDRKFMQDKRVGKRPSRAMASFHFFKREAKKNRPRRIQNMSDFGPNFILKREKRHCYYRGPFGCVLVPEFTISFSLADPDNLLSAAA